MKNLCVKLLSLILIAGALLALYSCGGGDGDGDGDKPAEHTHTLVYKERVNATCTADGSVEHWECSSCSKKFSDADAKNELSSVAIPASHTLSYTAASVATCTADGSVEYWSCSVCSKKFADADAKNELSSVAIPASHTISHTAAKDYGCIEDGNIEYWSCSVCLKKFSDADAKNEVTNTAVPAAHRLTHKSKTEPTCTVDGYEEHWQCSACLTRFADAKAEIVIYNVLLCAGHNYVDGVCQACSANGTPELVYELGDGGYTVIGVSDKNIFEIVVPAKHNDLPVVAIAEKAFEDCKNLTLLEIGENVSSIADGFWDGCDNLVEIINRSSVSEYPADRPEKLVAIHDGETRVKNVNGYIFFIYNDGKAHLVNYVGNDSILELPKGVGVDNSLVMLLPYILTANDFESTILIPMLDCFAQKLVEYCGESNPDLEFSFFENDSYYPYYKGCINASKTVDGKKGLRAYLNEMNSVISKSLNKSSDEYKELKKIHTDIAILTNGAYTLKNPGAYDEYDEADQHILERMYEDFPITQTGVAVYVYAGADTYLQMQSYADIIAKYIPGYTHEVMYEQEKACGYDRSSYTIGYKAFYGNKNIVSVTIPTTVECISKEAFALCENLEKIVIGNDVTEIDESAFDGCDKLAEIIVSPDNRKYSSIDGNLYSADGKTLIRFAPGKTAPSVVISSTVEKISVYAFAGCKNLKSVTIPETVTLVGDGYGSAYTFIGCTSLESVIIEAELEYIASGMFAGCVNLKEVILPASIKNIASNAFYHCESLESIVLPDSVMYVGTYAFGCCTSLQSIVIPDSVTYIDVEAFSGCTSLKSITIGKGLKEIGRDAFSGCENLESVNVTDLAAWCAVYLNDLEGNPLYNAKNLYLNGELVTELVIPDGVESISHGVFLYCESIETVYIPDSVTYIGSSAFAWCKNIKSVTIGSGLAEMIGDVFALCPEIESFAVSSDNEYFVSVDGKLYSKDGKVLVAYAIGNDETSFTVPQGVEEIGACAFAGRENLISIVISDSVKAIGYEAFIALENLEQVTVGSGVEEILGEMFAMCEKLVNISVSPDNQYYSTIDGNLYTKDGKTLVLYAIGKEAEKFTVPVGVESISGYAFFASEHLKEIVISDGVIKIEYGAFVNCGNLLKVVIPASVEVVELLAFDGCDNLTIYCEAETRPDGWIELWSASEISVIWNYKSE